MNQGPGGPATSIPVEPATLLPNTLRLAGRFALPLIVWFSAGKLARYVLIIAGVEVSHGSYEQVRRVAALTLFTALVLVTLAVKVGMLTSVRRGLALGRNGAGESFADVVGRSLFPLVIIYLAWNFYVDDVREFSRVDLERNLFDPRHESVAGKALGIDNLWIALAALVIAWTVKAVLERRHEQTGGRALSVGIAFFETAFNMFAVSSVLVLVGDATDWISGRVFWQHIAGPFSTQDYVTGTLLPLVMNALVLPLIWLMAAMLVYGYGIGVDDHRAALVGTRFERLAGKAVEAPSRTRRITALVTTGSRERWVPLAYSLRMVAEAGIAVFGMFVFCYAAIELGVAYGFRGVLHLIGPGYDPAAWKAILVPVEFGRDLVHDVLILSLLAATVDLVVARTKVIAAAAAQTLRQDAESDQTVRT